MIGPVHRGWAQRATALTIGAALLASACSADPSVPIADGGPPTVEPTSTTDPTPTAEPPPTVDPTATPQPPTATPQPTPTPTPTSEPIIVETIHLVIGEDVDQLRATQLEGGMRDGADAAGIGFEVTRAVRAGEADEVVTELNGNSDVVVAFGREVADATGPAAQEHPETRYVVINSGAPRSDVAVWSLAGLESAYVAGTVAATAGARRMGWVDDEQTPLAQSSVLAFLAGAQSIEPDAELLEVFTGDNNDGRAAFEATSFVLDAGAEVVFAGIEGALPDQEVAAVGRAELIGDATQCIDRERASSDLPYIGSVRVDVAASGKLLVNRLTTVGLVPGESGLRINQADAVEIDFSGVVDPQLVGAADAARTELFNDPVPLLDRLEPDDPALIQPDEVES